MTLDMTQPYIRGGVGLDRRKISGMGEIPDFKSILSIPGSALFLQISETELTDLRDIQSKSGKVCIARTMAIVREMITMTLMKIEMMIVMKMMRMILCVMMVETRREAMISDGLDCKPGFRVVCGLPQHDCRQCLAKYGFLLQLPGII